jgi:hypothetical protein
METAKNSVKTAKDFSKWVFANKFPKVFRLKIPKKIHSMKSNFLSGNRNLI